MTTEFVFLYLLLIVYMLFNVYTDYTWLITKNIWHLTIIVFGTFYATLKGEVWIAVIALLVGLLFGIALGKIPKSDFGAGDIKMLAVSSMILMLMKPHTSTWITVLTLIIFYLVLSYMIIYALKKIHRKGKREVLVFGSYKISPVYIETPEAIPICIACLIVPFVI